MEEFKNPFKGEIIAAPQSDRPRYRRFRHASLKGTLIVCGILVLLLPLVFVTARPLYSALKGWRASRLVAQAEALIAQEEWEEALQKAQAATILAPKNARNMRVVARTFAHFGSERALDFWQFAVAINPAAQEDRRQLIDTALIYQQFTLANSHSAELLKQAPDDPQNLLAAAKVALASQDALRELPLLQRGATLAPANPEIDFRLRRVLAEVGSREQAPEALAAIRPMAERTDGIGLEALDFFVGRPVAEFPDRLRMAQLLDQHPLATSFHRVKACAVAIDAEPSSRSTRLDRLIQSVAGQKPEVIAPVADWLLRLGDTRRVLELLPWEIAQGSEQLTLAHADALSRTGQLARLNEILSTPGLRLRSEFIHLCRWQASLGTREAGASDHEARAAIEAAEGSPGSLAYLAARFEELGKLDVAEQAYSKLHSAPKFETVAMLGLVRIARRNQDTKVLLKRLGQARQDGNSDPSLDAEIMHLALLLRQDVLKNRNAAALLAVRNPGRMVVHTAHALACLRDGDPAAALDVFKNARFEWMRATPSMRAVFAAALLQSGHAAQASEIIASFSPNQLLSEERELLVAKSGK